MRFAGTPPIETNEMAIDTRCRNTFWPEMCIKMENEYALIWPLAGSFPHDKRGKWGNSLMKGGVKPTSPRDIW